jgi:hypothetical protein
MVQRYMLSDTDAQGKDVGSMIQEMMDGAFESADPLDDPKFKPRTMSDKEFILPDITEAITRYSGDMNHFIAYAEYATKLKALLSNEEFKGLIEAHRPDGTMKYFNKFLDHVIDGSASRVSDRAMMKAHFRLLGWLARNKIASPRSGFMQFTALAGFTDPTTSTPVTAVELAQALPDLIASIKSGEIRNLTDTAYMEERWLGAFDQLNKLAEEVQRSEMFRVSGKFDPGGVLRKLGTNKTLHNWMTISTRFGDRGPSVLGGWAVYRKVLNQTGDKVKAIQAAIKAIEEVNGSLDPAKSPEVYTRTDFVSTLYKLFTRSTSIYIDRYIRMHKAFASGQITKAQWLEGMVLYHVWIPMFTSTVAMGAGAEFDDEEMKTLMLAGPLSFHLLIGGLFKTVAATLWMMSPFFANEKFATGYLGEGDILDGYTRDVGSAFKKIREAAEYPDFENIWASVAGVGKLGDVLPLPVGYLSRTPEAIYKILEGYWGPGLMELMGYSSAATKVE